MTKAKSVSVSDALVHAASLIKELADQNFLAKGAAEELEKVAELDGLKGIEVDAEEVQRLVSDSTIGKRHGATFLTRPKWLDQRDLFSLSSDGAHLAGWNRPTPNDHAMLEQLQDLLKTEGRASSDGEAETSQDERDAVDARLSSIDIFNEDVLLAEPPFLPGVTLIHLALESSDGDHRPTEGLFFSRKNDEGEMSVENFEHSSPKVHELNASHPALEVAGNELGYLRYFLQVVRAGAGAFRVIEGHLLERISKIVDASGASDKTAADVLKDWTPPRFFGAGPEGGLLYEAYVLYGGAIFKTLFCVYASGMVEMLDDQPLLNPLEDLMEG